MKKKNLIKNAFLILLFISPFLVFVGENLRADGLYWARVYGTSVDPYVADEVDEVPMGVAQTEDGGFIVAGHFYWGGSNISFLKLDKSGNIEWSRRYEIDGGEFMKPHTFDKTQDGGFIAAGYDNSGWSNDDLVVLKTDGEGRVQWYKKFIFSGSDIPYAVKQISDGGYLVVSKGYGPKLFWITKLSEAGDIEWQEKYEYMEGQKWSLWNIDELSDGDLILSGSIDARGWIGKMDREGNFLWSKKYDRGAIGYFHSGIRETQDGGFVAVGGVPDRRYDLWIVKTDSEGEPEWSKIYGTDNVEDVVNMTSASDGGFVITGIMRIDPRHSDAWIVKIDAEGNIAWQKAYGGPPWTALCCDEWDMIKDDCVEWYPCERYPSECGSAISETSEGGFVVAGRTDSPDPDFLVLRLNKNGEIPGCPYLRDTDVVPIDVSVETSDVVITSSPIYVEPVEYWRVYKYGPQVREDCVWSCESPQGCLPPSEYSFFPSLKNPPWWGDLPEHKYKTDINCDGCVDELIEFSYSFGSFCGDDWHDSDADFNEDNIVDGMDLSIFINDFGAGCF